jgi:hypothetical protein
MEYKTLNNEVLTFPENILIEKLSVQELINLALDTDNDFTIIKSRQELIGRGKDNIQIRITIKKTCKSAINDLEVLLKRFDCESNADKKNTKLYKTKFLNTLSLVDKLQLEWQKHDLSLKR